MSGGSVPPAWASYGGEPWLCAPALRLCTPARVRLVLICEAAAPTESTELWALQGILALSGAPHALVVRLGRERAASGGAGLIVVGEPSLPEVVQGDGIRFVPWAPVDGTTLHATVSAALAESRLRPVSWGGCDAVVAFVDGACTKNGKPGARAGFAAAVIGGQFGAYASASVLRGEVAPLEYEFVDAADPARGIRTLPGRSAAPSNNRGELMGLIYAFLALLRGRARGPVEVVSDSNISVQTLLAYLPARLAKGTEHELKNFDLVMVAWRLLSTLRAQAASVAITHVRSHQAPPPASAPARARLFHRGNDMADRHATAAIDTPAPCYAVEVLDAPTPLMDLAS